MTQVAERSKPQPQTAVGQRSDRRTEVAWAPQVSRAITQPFATQAEGLLDQHPKLEIKRPFAIARGVPRVLPAATDDDLSKKILKFFDLHYSPDSFPEGGRENP